MYDWANSAYSTYQITILMLYLQQVVLPGPSGQIAYGYGIGISTLIAAVLSPLLGAVADAHASKRFWLTVATLAGAGASIAMFFLPVEYSWAFVGLFFTTSLSFELAWGLYNAFLPEIADETSMNRVSAYGFAMGYIGGGLALLIGVLVVQFGDRLGLPSNLEGDCVVGHEIDFEVQVPPGNYDVTVWLGDLRARTARSKCCSMASAKNRNARAPARSCRSSTRSLWRIAGWPCNYAGPAVTSKRLWPVCALRGRGSRGRYCSILAPRTRPPKPARSG